MSIFLGLDLGTSAVKAVLVDEAQTIVAETTAAIRTQHPHPLWAEQDPDDWWAAVCGVLDGFRARHPDLMQRVRGIGLSGQMHGAVCVDASGRPLRPAILWNDVRASAEAAELARNYPDLPATVGVVPMASFNAPKMMWLARHEPGVFDAVDAVLLPKDDVRWRLTGVRATDMCDASGTWWLDVARRAWSAEALDAERDAAPPGPLAGGGHGGVRGASADARGPLGAAARHAGGGRGGRRGGCRRRTRGRFGRRTRSHPSGPRRNSW